MNPLTSRKQLLVAESELNRAQLVADWQTMTDDAQAIADQARTIRSLASATASLLAGLAAFRRKVSTPPGEKLPWWHTLLKSAGVVSSFWTEFRSRPKS